MTLYVTKHALTSGIKKRDDLKERDDGFAYGKPGWEIYRVGVSCFRTYEEAKKDAESKVDRKIELLQKQIESLKRLKFSEPK